MASNNLNLKVSIHWSDEELHITGRKPIIVLVDTLCSSTAIAVALKNGMKKVDVLSSLTDVISSNNLVSVIGRFGGLGADVLTSAFVNASYTIHYILERKYDEVIFVPIGTYIWEGTVLEHPKKNLEDYFAAAYMVRLIEKITGILFKSINLHRRLIDRTDMMIEELKSGEHSQRLLNSKEKSQNDLNIYFSIDSNPIICKLFVAQPYFFSAEF